MRTSRHAWGASLDSHDAVLEWELGSRVMEGMLAENMPRLGTATIKLRASRAYMAVPVDNDGEEYLDCLVTVKGRPDELYFCYDIADDGRLMANIVEPPLPDGASDLTLIPPEFVEDSTPWALLDKEKGDDNKAV